MWRSNPLNLGEFKERDHGRFFTYRPTTDAWALSHGLHHEIDVLDGVRFANVLKTVAHICVDEEADGQPKLETWRLLQHKRYEQT